MNEVFHLQKRNFYEIKKTAVFSFQRNRSLFLLLFQKHQVFRWEIEVSHAF